MSPNAKIQESADFLSALKSQRMEKGLRVDTVVRGPGEGGL